MSNRISIVHHFFPLNLQLLEKLFVKKICLISEKSNETTLKTSICSHIIYMRHQRSFVHHFFLLRLQVLEKNS